MPITTFDGISGGTKDGRYLFVVATDSAAPSLCIIYIEGIYI